MSMTLMSLSNPFLPASDHAENCEVTWHGKGTEDKRGETTEDAVRSKCWLYLCGKSIVCSRHQEVAAIVSSINPSINATSDSLELSILQQELLWLLYDMGHLSRYPMALGNLADLEEFAPSPGRLMPVELYEKAIQTNWEFFANHHVYPYTYYGGYLYRNGRYKEALMQWAKAADVISRYNYNREDEEIYKEFLEINNELIPHLMKVTNA
jgi:menin